MIIGYEPQLVILLRNYFAFAITEGKAICNTEKGDEQGADKGCVFPFKYYGIEYTACAQENGIVWCSTETGKSEF